jgi:hypothetical protein
MPGQVAIVASNKLSVMKQIGSWASKEQVAAATPTCALIITETMELNEWSVSVLNVSMIKPSENLLKYLKVTGDDSLHSNPLKDTMPATENIDTRNKSCCMAL